MSDDCCNGYDDGNNNKSIHMLIINELYPVFKTLVMMLMIKTKISYDVNY